MALFIKIPKISVLDFTFMKFVDYVLDFSPVIASRSMQRRVGGVVSSIESAIACGDDYAEFTNPEAARIFASAVDEVDTPRLMAEPRGANGEPLGEGHPIPARAFDPFYEAFENMTETRPMKQGSGSAET